MNKKLVVTSKLIAELYRLFIASVDKRLTRSEIVNLIYRDDNIPKEDSITRKINNYRKEVELRYRCTITKKGYRYHLCKKSNPKNDLKQKFDQIETSVAKNLNGNWNIIELKQYYSQKGIQDYKIIIMDTGKIENRVFFKAYQIELDNLTGKLILTSEKLKRFYLTNCGIINSNSIKGFLNEIIDSRLLTKLNKYKELETDDFGFATKYGTSYSKATILFPKSIRQYIKNYFLNTSENRVLIESLGKKLITSNGVELLYKIEIRYNNLKHLLALIVPYIEFIRFENDNELTTIKEGFVNYVNSNFKTV
jgi:hypothetical protein